MSAVARSGNNKTEFRVFDCYFQRNDNDFDPRQRRGDRQNIEYYIERIHEQVKSDSSS